MNLLKILGIREPKTLKEKLYMEGFRIIATKGDYEILNYLDRFIIYCPKEDKVVREYNRWDK